MTTILLLLLLMIIIHIIMIMILMIMIMIVILMIITMIIKILLLVLVVIVILMIIIGHLLEGRRRPPLPATPSAADRIGNFVFSEISNIFQRKHFFRKTYIRENTQQNRKYLFLETSFLFPEFTEPVSIPGSGVAVGVHGRPPTEQETAGPQTPEIQ